MTEETSVRRMVVDHVCQCEDCVFGTRSKCLTLGQLGMDFDPRVVREIVRKLMLD